MKDKTTKHVYTTLDVKSAVSDHLFGKELCVVGLLLEGYPRTEVIKTMKLNVQEFNTLEKSAIGRLQCILK